MMDIKTVLVVEDNILNMKLFKTLLEMGKYKVLCAEDARTGIDLAVDHIPDLILMDIQLPDMDGVTATRQLKSNPKTQQIPVVALTAYAMERDIEMVMNSGFAGHIAKPIDTKDFLPIVSQYLQESTGESVTPKSSSKPFILIVDDDRMNVKLLDTYLKQEGFNTAGAYDGAEALEKIRENPPDMILLDIMMPGINGYEVTRKLKSDQKTSHIPIILITALDSADDKSKGMAAGADEFLNKPINKPELLARVRSFLKLRVYQEQLANRLRSEQEILRPIDQKSFVEVHQESHRILLVEDNPNDINLFKLYLKNQNYRIDVAHTGEEAILICRQEDVDVVLLDLLLPGVDGYQVCRRLREDDKTRNIQIMMVSSQSDLECKLKGIDLGADEFLVKPIIREELVVRIKALVKKKCYLDQLMNRLESALSVSMTDSLTELYNQTYLKHFMEIEIRRCERQHESMAFIMIDIDNFKDYNDKYGHPEGDVLLKQFGRLLKSSIRDIDLAARYGGEEFGIVLPYANKETAKITAERLLNNIRNYSKSEGSNRLHESKTASMGIASYPDDSETAAGLIQLADIALYRAKKEGKNQACVY
jgi:two-component system, cell cycle response regulator